MESLNYTVRLEDLAKIRYVGLFTCFDSTFSKMDESNTKKPRFTIFPEKREQVGGAL